MGFLVIGDLIARARRQPEDLSALEFSHQLAFQDEKNVPLGAPVICEITRRILNHPHTHLAESAGSPVGRATLPRMLDRRDPLPISDPKGNIVHLHGTTLAPYCRRSVLPRLVCSGSHPAMAGAAGPPAIMTGAASLRRFCCNLSTPQALRAVVRVLCLLHNVSAMPVHTM